MPDRPPPIRVGCEGTGHPVSRPVGLFSGKCPACDCTIGAHKVDDSLVVDAHDRNDVTAMVARGDFDG